MTGLPQHVKSKLASHFQGFDLDGIEIRPGIPRHVRMFAAIEPVAYASGNVLYFSDDAYDTRSERGIALIGHEVAHSMQYAKSGKWRFRMKYLGYYFRNRMRGMAARESYESIPFEEEARRIQTLIHEDLLRRSVRRSRREAVRA